MAVLFFDLDGTLVDSTEPITRSLSVALQHHDLPPVTPSEVGRHIGPPLRESVGALLESLDADAALLSSVIEAYRQDYAISSIELALAYPGITDMLCRLAGTVRLGVVTSKPHRFAVPILETLGFADVMEVIEGPRDTESEQKPETLNRAIERLAPKDESICMVGDRHHDITAGRSLGTATLGVSWGFGSVEELREAGADRVVHHPREIEAPNSR